MTDWNDMPTELKLAMLRPCLLAAEPITARAHTEVYAPELTKYSLVSSEMRDLALEVYYKENTFLFSRAPISATSPIIFHLPKAPIAHMLRRIELHIKVPTLFDSVENLLAKTSTTQEKGNDSMEHHVTVRTDLLALVRPHRAQSLGDEYMMPYADGTKFATRFQIDADNIRIFGRRLPQRMLDRRRDRSLPATYDTTLERPVRSWTSDGHRLSNWQKTMPNLQHVKIVVQVDSCLNAHKREEFAKLPVWAGIPGLRAKKAEIVVEVAGCHDRSVGAWAGWGIQTCDGECAGVVKCVVEEMLKE